MERILFKEDSPFVLNDNRRNRKHNPTTADSLNKRFSVLLPKSVVKDQTVLDLGACLGQAGYWALVNGASSYTGVELQQDYADKMKTLLADFDNAECIESGIVEFCESDSRQWDTVVLSGVLYGFLDYYSILKAATDKAKKFVVIDMLSFGDKLNTNPMISIKLNQKLNAANDNASYIGIGCRINPIALSILMQSLGFKCVNSDLPLDLKNYKESERRYISQFERTEESLITLQDKLKNKSNPNFYW